MSGITYRFTDAIQEKILSVLWKDNISYSLYKDCIKPRYFEKAVRIDICRLILSYYENYGCPPTLEVMEEEVREIVDKSKAKKSVEDEYYEALHRIIGYELDDLEYVKEKILEFGKRAALIDAVMESSEIIDKNGEFNKVKVLVEEALHVGEDIGNIGIRYFHEVDQRVISYQYAEDVIERITTGKPMLDDILKGGIGRAELACVVAPPGRGKTSWLIDIGVAALEAGYNVFHYSLENSEKVILRNYDTRVTKRNIDYIRESPDSIIKTIKNVKRYKARNAELVIKKYPTKSINLNTIKSHIKEVELVLGIKPDLIVIDYGSLLKPIDYHAEKRDSIECIFEEIRALCDELDCAIWTGAQLNRGSLGKKVVGMADLAECFAIANIVDFMVALCQTPKEQRRKVMRYFIAKNRDNPGNQTFRGLDLRDIRMMTIDELVVYKDKDGDGGDWDEKDDDEEEEQ